MNKRKTDILSVLAIATFLGAFYSLFLSDDIATYRSLRHKRSSIREAIQRDTSTLEREKRKMFDVLNLEEELKGHRLFLLKGDTVPYFLTYVSSLARRYRVEILSIEPGGAVDGELFTRTTFTAELKGGFPYVYNLLYHLEEDWRGIKLETLSIDKDAAGNSVNVKLTVAVLSIEGLKEGA